MLNKTVLLAFVCGAFVFTACGGGGGSKEDPVTKEMKKRDTITILHEYPAVTCQSDTLKIELLKAGFHGIITSVEDNSINCAHYGRKNDGNSCYEELFGGYPNACVIGANIGSGVAGIESITIASDNAIAEVQ